MTVYYTEATEKARRKHGAFFSVSSVKNPLCSSVKNSIKLSLFGWTFYYTEARERAGRKPGAFFSVSSVKNPLCSSVKNSIKFDFTEASEKPRSGVFF